MTRNRDYAHLLSGGLGAKKKRRAGIRISDELRESIEMRNPVEWTMGLAAEAMSRQLDIALLDMVGRPNNADTMGLITEHVQTFVAQRVDGGLHVDENFNVTEEEDGRFNVQLTINQPVNQIRFNVNVTPDD